MKKIISLSLLFTFILGVLILGPSPRAEAQSTVSVPQNCVALSSNLRIGQYSSNVTNLQNYLISKGYLHNYATGYFGGLTYAAVVLFQTDHGVTPSGYVGPVTRGVIQADSCGGSPTPTPIPNPTNTVSIFSINPGSGPVGTTVTLSGSNFTSYNTVFFGSGSIGPVAATYPTCSSIGSYCSTGQGQITFTVPSSVIPYCAPNSYYCPLTPRPMITPGTYPIYIANANGTSNSVNFTVTGDGMYGTLSISGIDAPNTLAVNNTGTWMVHVTGAQNGTLHYNVLWGDEIYYGAGAMSPTSYPVYSNATFTHTYTRTGIFNPQFTVTDDFGHSVTGTASVNVTPQYMW